MKGHVERRLSAVTGKVTYRPCVYVGKREAAFYGIESGWHYGTTCKRLKPHGDEPCAETALEDMKASLAAAPPVTCTDTVAELCERWLRDGVRPDRRANTVRAHEKAVTLHIVPQLGCVLADALTPAEVATWQAAQLASGAAPKSVRNYRGSLHACYVWALGLGLVTRNPVSAVPAPRLPERRTTAPSLTTAQAYIAALAKTRLWPPLFIAATTGMRRGEVLALRWQDVDLATGSAHIFRNLTGRNRATLTFGPPKTRAGSRTITLPAHSPFV